MRYHVLAGVQLERMIEGIEAVSKGRVTDIRGRTLFEVEPEDYLKAITMGPYRTEPGKEYIKKRRKSKSLLERLEKKKAKKWRITPKRESRLTIKPLPTKPPEITLAELGKDITYKTKIKVEETGEVVEISMNAGQAIKDVDKKLAAYQKIFDDIGA